MPDNENETEEERFDRLYKERRAAEKAEEERAATLKKLGLSGDVLDAFADAVWDRGEARAEARRKAAEEADQPPSTGSDKPKRGFFGSIIDS